jgi:acetyltransferase-like isoleucine patch superfamily enzyme
VRTRPFDPWPQFAEDEIESAITVLRSGPVNYGAGEEGRLVDNQFDVEIGDYAHISPNASLGGASRAGPLAHMGIGSVLLPGVRVGAGSIVGAGAVVLKGSAG